MKGRVEKIENGVVYILTDRVLRSFPLTYFKEEINVQDIVEMNEEDVVLNEK